MQRTMKSSKIGLKQIDQFSRPKSQKKSRPLANIYLLIYIYKRFLKNADELASSTLLVAKRDAMKKSRDFASIIKQQVEQNRRERASKKRASTRITFSADNESPTISKRF